MRVTVYATGIDDLMRRLDVIAQEPQYQFVRRKALRAGIRVAKRYAKNNMSTSSPSSPGSPPGVDTGNLKDSIKVGEVTGDHAILEATADYAGYLEFGTRRMAARPYMRPSVLDHMDEIQEVMTRVVDEALDGR